MLFGKKSLKTAVDAAVEVAAKNKGMSMFIMAIFMSVLFSQSVYARDVRVFFDGKEIQYAVPAQIIADYTMVPLSQTFEALVGAGTSYDPATRTSTFHANGHVNVHTIGTNYVYIDGVPREYPTPSVIIGDRALVPIRMITETSGLTVEWDDINYFVKISSPQPVVTPQPAATQQPNAPVVISSVASNKTTVNPGESVVLTVITNSAANYVWFNDGTKNISMTFAAEDAAHAKTWVLSYTPSATINLPIYASANQDMSGAVQQNLAITVGSISTISSVVANKTSIAAGEEVTLTIKTNSAATYVRADYDNTNAVATYNSTDSAGIKTWTAVVKPTSTQNIVVYANTTQTTTGAASQNLAVTVNSTAVAILSVTPNRTSINAGETVQFSIRTSAAANYVWANFNSTSVQATYSSTDSSGVKTWVVNCNPSSTQQIIILANSTQTTSGAVTNNATTITVAGSAISIINASAPSVAVGNNVTVTVQTSAATNYVVVDFGNGYLQEGSYRYNDSNGYKVWELSYYVSASTNYTVYAGSTYGSKEVSKTFTLNVSDSSQGVKIIDVYPSIYLGFSNFSCEVTTNELASEVYFVYNGSYYYFSPSYYSGYIKWTLSTSIQYDGVNKQATVNAVSSSLHGNSSDSRILYFNE